MSRKSKGRNNRGNIMESDIKEISRSRGMREAFVFDAFEGSIYSRTGVVKGEEEERRRCCRCGAAMISAPL